MIDRRRPGQRSFGEGLIDEETANLREPWMRQADQVLEDEQLVQAVYEPHARPAWRFSGDRPADAAAQAYGTYASRY